MPRSQNIRDQLHRLNEWQDAHGNASDVSLIAYVGFEATPEILLACAELFDPEIVEHEGVAFLKEKFDEDIFNGWVKTGAAVPEIQKPMNQIHVRTLIQGDDISDELALHILEKVASIWRSTIPNCTSLISGEDFWSYSVTFFNE